MDHLGSRILSLAISGVFGFASYILLKYWWDIYNTIYAKITPMEHTVAGIAFWLGLVTAFVTIIFVVVTFSD